MRQIFTMTQKQDPSTVWWMLGVAALIMGIGVGIGFLVGHPIYVPIVALPFALLAAMFILARRAERAAYGQIAGQPGAVGAALGSLRRGWMPEQTPVAADYRTQDLVFRAVGRGGVVLVGEGSQGRLNRLLETERRRITKVTPNVPVHTYIVGDREGQVPLTKVVSTVHRLRPKLTKAEALAVSKRLKALGGLKPPIPAGVDPSRARPDRKAMRGR